MITIEVLLDKSDRALASAQLLFSAGDYEGACNRAYYAMFDAAKAALLHACQHRSKFDPFYLKNTD